MNSVVRDLLSAGRVANLPTVWSNLFCSILLTTLTLRGDLAELSAYRLVITLLTGSLLYTGGCFLNDYYDRNWDAEHKPHRAIPKGRLSPTLLLSISLFTFFTGLLCAFTLGSLASLSALLIVCLISIYTVIHKKTAWGILPMGLCRASLYFLGFSCVNDIPLTSSYRFTYPQSLTLDGGLLHLLIPALSLLLYIAGITLVARSESKAHLPKAIKYIGVILILFPILNSFKDLNITPQLVSSVILLLLLLFIALRQLNKGKIGSFVSLCLAGISLVDLVAVLAVTPAPTPFFIPITFALFPALFLISISLQRLAPAT